MRKRRLLAWLRPKRKRIEIRRGKHYPTVFVPRPDRELLDDIESSFDQSPPKE